MSSILEIKQFITSISGTDDIINNIIDILVRYYDNKNISLTFEQMNEIFIRMLSINSDFDIQKSLEFIRYNLLKMNNALSTRLNKSAKIIVNGEYIYYEIYDMNIEIIREHNDDPKYITIIYFGERITFNLEYLLQNNSMTIDLLDITSDLFDINYLNHFLEHLSLSCKKHSTNKCRIFISKKDERILIPVYSRPDFSLKINVNAVKKLNAACAGQTDIRLEIEMSIDEKIILTSELLKHGLHCLISPTKIKIQDIPFPDIKMIAIEVKIGNEILTLHNPFCVVKTHINKALIDKSNSFAKKSGYKIINITSSINVAIKKQQYFILIKEVASEDEITQVIQIINEK